MHARLHCNAGSLSPPAGVCFPELPLRLKSPLQATLADFPRVQLSHVQQCLLVTTKFPLGGRASSLQAELHLGARLFHLAFFPPAFLSSFAVPRFHASLTPAETLPATLLAPRSYHRQCQSAQSRGSACLSFLLFLFFRRFFLSSLQRLFPFHLLRPPGLPTRLCLPCSGHGMLCSHTERVAWCLSPKLSDLPLGYYGLLHRPS